MPYKFKWRGDRGAYYVSYKHIPGKWFSTGCATRRCRVLVRRRADAFQRREQRAKADANYPSSRTTSSGPEDPHGHRRRNEGAQARYEPTHYSAQSKARLNYILPKNVWHLLDSITDVAIEDWLLS